MQLKVLPVAVMGWLLLCAGAWAEELDAVVINEPEVVVASYEATQSCAVPGHSYNDLSITEDEASFLVSDGPRDSGSQRVGAKGIKRVSWEPAEDGQTRVTLKLSAEPEYAVINAMPGSELRPQTPQVILALGFSAGELQPATSVLGGQRKGSGGNTRVSADSGRVREESRSHGRAFGDNGILELDRLGTSGVASARLRAVAGEDRTAAQGHARDLRPTAEAANRRDLSGNRVDGDEFLDARDGAVQDTVSAKRDIRYDDRWVAQKQR